MKPGAALDSSPGTVICLERSLETEHKSDLLNAKGWERYQRRGRNITLPHTGTALGNCAASKAPQSSRRALGISTREALMAQLREEAQLISAASKPPPGARTCQPVTQETTEKDAEEAEQRDTQETIDTQETCDTSSDFVVDMTPTFVQEIYGAYGAVPAWTERRARSNRLTCADLTGWMASAGITRDGIADAARGATL